jgi:hypothetical protein
MKFAGSCQGYPSTSLFKLVQVVKQATPRMTTDHTHDAALKALIVNIEAKLSWGSGLDWSTRDFEQLSVQICERTGVQLSVVTLKRVWKKIEYAGKPTITTLNALAEFVGAQSWQQFKQQHTTAHAELPVEGNMPLDSSVMAPKSEGPTPFFRRYFTNGHYGPNAFGWIIVSACAAAVVFYVTAFRPSGSKRDKNYAFSSKKVVDTGVPNTVIFDYDASASEDDDSVSIQQSWDPRLSRAVDHKLKQFTSIYYHPGFFDARLKVSNEVVKKHALLIKSNGWLPLLDTNPSPVYFSAKDIMQNGRLALPIDQIRSTGIVLQPDAPWCNYYKVGDLPAIKSDDFVFETRVRNDFGEGAAACRKTEVHILFEGAAMVVPLSVPGCVSTLEFHDVSGKVSDLSALGVKLDDWVDLKFEVADTVASLYINSQKAFDLKVKMMPMSWVGMIFKFKGTGSVDFVRVSRNNGDVVYEESF